MTDTETILAQKVLHALLSFPRFPRCPCPIPGLKPSELVMLFHIRQELLSHPSGSKITDLSKSLAVTPPTVTQLVTRLDKLGLVTKSHTPSDRRAVFIRLTPAGESLLRRAEADFLHRSLGLVQRLGEVRTQQLIDIMALVSAYLGDGRNQAAHHSTVSD